MELREPENHPQQPHESAVAPVPTSSRSRAWRTVFPEPMGVAIAATLVLGLAAVGVIASYAIEGQRAEAQSSEGQALVDAFATTLGHFGPDRSAEIDATFSRLCGIHTALRSAEWLDPDGQVQCQWPGSAVAEIATELTGDPVGAARPLAVPPEADGLAVFEAAVETSEGVPAGLVRLKFAFPDREQPFSSLLRGWAMVAVAALLVYFVLYRRLRRHLRPLDAIQRNLHSYASGLEKEFVALSLSDSLGHIAQSWNHLIDQFAALREQDTEVEKPNLADDALRRFESRTLRSTLDRLPIGIVRFGPDQQLSYANIAAGRLLGHSAETLVGMSLADAIDEEVRAPLVGAYQRSMAAMSIDRKRGDDEQQTTLRFALIPSVEGSPDGEALVTIEDVSHLQEADRARDNFLYHVTHELRTPLTNIQAYAETLTGPGFDDEQTRRECYNVIISETRRLSRLVEDILNISQLEVGTARIEMGDVDLVRLLRQIVQDHLGAADEKQIDLTLKLAPKVPKVQGDKQRLSVLITNLIGNAIKYTPPGGQVDVTLEVHERCLEVRVADTGIGIAPEDQAHVFEKFYRAVSDEVQTIAGTGLGLAIAREVARLHGGDIRLESQPQSGSTFVVELPRSVDG